MVLFIFIIINNRYNESFYIMKGQYFLIGKEFFESSVVFPKL